MPQTNPFNGPVVIVGAGVAGLTTALLLQEAGAEVVVIEKLNQVGGLARSYTYDDFIFDVGPHRFHTENTNVATFLERILKGDATWFPRVSEVYFKGKYYSWPLKPQNLTQLPPGLAIKSAIDLATNNFKTYDTDSFENYVLRQYGPTLYQNFFKGYSQKFLGIHPAETHPDWAKVGINRAIIDNNLQMQNLSQLLKTTLRQFKEPDAPHFLYPTNGLQQAWDIVAHRFKSLGGQIYVGSDARMEHDGSKVTRIWAGDRASFEPSQVVWTAPITVATDQLGLEKPNLDYLGLLLFNVCAKGGVPREYQWCYYGADDLVFNRISIPRFFSEKTAPPGSTGFCVEVTCMKGDARWEHAERLTDWVVDDLVRVGMLPNRRAVHDVYVERVQDSYPIYHKRYTSELEQARNDLSRFENLHLAGRTGMFWYNNMDHSIENAMQLSKRLLRDAGRLDVQERALASGNPA